MARWASAAALLTAAALVTLSFAGQLHPIGDSLAAFRPWLAALTAGLAVLAVIAGMRWGAFFAMVVAVAALSAPVSAMLNAPPVVGERTVRVYQKNLRNGRATPDEVVEDILASGADLVTLQELQGGATEILDRLRASHPTQHTCPYGGIGGVAIVSRWPAVAELCAERRGMVALRVDAPAGPLWVASTHLPWPWPFRQASHVRALLPDFTMLERPVIVGGDFNMAPWSWAVGAVADATGTERAAPVRATYDLMGWIGLPIDHVLTPHGWSARAQTRAKLGSDHRGLLVITAPPGA